MEVTLGTKAVRMLVALCAVAVLIAAAALLINRGAAASGAPAGVAPDNDDFSDAVTIAGLPFSATQGTDGFTTEFLEPTNPNNCVTSEPYTKAATAWYRLSPATGFLDLDTLGSDFDTVLAVYAGSGIDALTALACNDDGGIGFGLQSRLSAVAVSVGTTYYVQAGGFSGDSGQLHLNISFVTQPTATSTPVATPTATPGGEDPGDADCNGLANAIDATLILQLSAGLLKSLACEDGADVNGDGSINSLDAALVLQYVAGLLDEL